MKRLGIGLQVSLVIHGAFILCLYGLTRHVSPEIHRRTIDLAILSSLPPGGGPETPATEGPPPGPDPVSTQDDDAAAETPLPAAPEIIDAVQPPWEAATWNPPDEVEDIDEVEEPEPPPAAVVDKAPDPPPPPKPAKPDITSRKAPAAVARNAPNARKAVRKKKRPTPAPPQEKERPVTSKSGANAVVARKRAAAGENRSATADAGTARGPSPAHPPMGAGRAPGPRGGSPGTEDGYMQANAGAIHARLASRLKYPKIARKRGWCGRVLVAFTVLPDGRVERPEVRKSCGIALLDKSAVQTVKDASPFPSPGSTLRIVVPVVFRLES